MKLQFIPTRVHLALDVATGTALAVIPQLTGARKQGKRAWVPYIAIGAFEIALAALTKTDEPRETRVAKLVQTAKRAKDTAAKGVAKVR